MYIKKDRTIITLILPFFQGFRFLLFYQNHLFRYDTETTLHPIEINTTVESGTIKLHRIGTCALHLADGVLICGCHPGDCHYEDGNLKTEKRAEAINLMLEDFGIEEERFRLEWVSASEGPRFAQVAKEFTEQIKKLGPSPYKT